jgi:peptidoglycan/xylan/chitin deacetylase (PgdA/CDA1 family)
VSGRVKSERSSAGQAREYNPSREPRALLLGEVHTPRILNVLGELGLRSTFFVQGLNIELYPDALLGILDSGHELGYHG